jgi:predicted aspartyl protease
MFLLLLWIAASTPLTTADLLDRWAAAEGGRERIEKVQAVYREATLEVGGLRGTLKLWQTATGQTREEVSLASYQSLEIFDGTRGWAQQGQAPEHELAGANLEKAISEAYAGANAHFFPSRRKGTVTLDGNDVILRPEGGRESRVVLDPATWLPKAYVRREHERQVTTTVESWTDVDGLKFPAAMLQSTGDRRFDVRITFTKTVIDPPVDQALFSRPAPAVAVLPFPAGAHEVSVPFQLIQNHIHMPLSVNGTSPSSFILDTGADITVVDRDRAIALRIPIEGAIEMRGSGEQSVQTGLIADPKVTFGGMTLPVKTMAAVPLGALSLREGRSIDGILGYDILSRFIVTIDYAKGVVRFQDPATFAAPKAAAVLPLHFHGNNPIVAAAVTLSDGRTVPLRMLIDTGARSALVLNAPFVRKNVGESAPAGAIEGPLGAGIGGATNQWIGRVTKVTVAGFVIPSPVTSFSRDAKGSDASPDIDGLIGGEILRRFTLIVDYPHTRFLLIPNADFAQPFEYDMSGLLLTAADAKFNRMIVRYVLPGSPAEKAGLQPDDELQAIDGKSVRAMSGDAVRSLLMQPERRYMLTIGRSGTTLEVPLTTRRMV